MKHYGDITKINGAEVEPVDVITGGSPCQDLSVAGKRAGLAGERSGLFMEQIRIIKEMRKHEYELHSGRADYSVRPRYMVWENVYGAFSSNGGEDFRAVLEETAKVAQGDAVIPRLADGQKWPSCGYILGDRWSIAWRGHDAQYWGVPQRRKRVCMVADFNGHSAPLILFDPQYGGETEYAKTFEAVADPGNKSASEVQPFGESMSGDIEPCGETREDPSSAVAESIGNTMSGDHGERSICFEPGTASRVGGHVYSETTGTIRSNPGDNQQCVIGFNRERGVATMEDAMPTIQAAAGESGNNKPMVCIPQQPISCTTEMTPKTDENGVGFSLRSRDYKDPQIVCLNDQGGSQMGVTNDVSGTLRAQEHGHQPVVYGISPYASNAMMSDNPHSGIYKADTSRTLDLNGGSPACNQGGMIVLEGNGQRESHQGDGYRESEVSYTLNTVEQHAVCVGVDSYNLAETGDVSRTLASTRADNEHLPVVMEQQTETYQQVTGTLSPGAHAGSYNGQDAYNDMLICQEVFENHSQDTRYRPMGDVSQSISATFGMGGNNQPFVVKKSVYDPSRRHSYQPFDEVCETIQAAYGTGGNNTPMVTETYQEKTGTIDCCISKGTSNQLANNNMFVANVSVVRRLTPLECERLQGFPDGWTDIGDWKDSKGKMHNGDSDSPRYKALGNSIALPFWRWMAKRMAVYLPENATMASLFDGIGGFPLVYQANGVKPVWASEIEEFPIAVTKLRFPEEDT